MRTKSKSEAVGLTLLFCVAALEAGAHPATAGSKPVRTLAREDTRNELLSRIYGCEAAGAIANSMGDVTGPTTTLLRCALQLPPQLLKPCGLMQRLIRS